MSPSLPVRFESTPSGGYVPVLANSALVDGAVASQTAGSTNPGLYYQVGGQGLNGAFAAALADAGQLEAANAELVRAYDAIYGGGAWRLDGSGPSPRRDRLTTVLVNLRPDGRAIGDQVRVLAYSVGPVLDRRGIVDHRQYQDIYHDALSRLAAERTSPARLVDAIRLTMLSCGIYGGLVDDRTALYRAAAHNIIVAAARALADHPRLDGLTLLVNANDQDRDGRAQPTPTERSAFTAAATGLGLAVDEAGFVIDPSVAAAGP
ncbi:MAG: hypothetical protein AAGK32_01380 [Actinomycetota bacterium]